MSFLVPAFLLAALGVAVGVVAVHFIVTRQPIARELPTTRFVPESSTLTTVTTTVPEDWPLLALRVSLILLVGAALARPLVTWHRRIVMRVILADVSRSVGRIAEVRDSARALYRPGDAFVVFDSSARLVGGNARDSIDRLVRANQDGALSPALITALRVASDHRTAADSFELVIITPFTPGMMDAATDGIRALWPGRARVVRVAAPVDSGSSASGFRVEGRADDPVRLAASLMGAPPTDPAVRLVRGVATAADSAWGALAGHTLVRWPADEAPPGWVPHAPVDTVGAIVTGGVALVAPLERRWQRAPAGVERIAARWVDGEPASVERRVERGCIRDVAFSVPAVGDLVLRPSFARTLRMLARPCDALVVGAAFPPSAMATLLGAGRLAAATAIPRPDVVATPLVPWLLAAALLVALTEIVVRRRPRTQ